MRCPQCSQTLIREEYHRKLVFRCSLCGGQFATLAALRGISRSKEFVNRLWLHAAHSKAPGIPCPDCGKIMRQVLLYPTPEIALELDVCIDCHAVWFDPGELKNIPLPEPEKDPLPQEARIILAERRAKKITGSDQSSFYETPDKVWKIIPCILGLPVERESFPLSRYPIITWSLSALCPVLFCLSLKDLSGVIADWGFIPADWSRFCGATLFSSMFLHGSWRHLLGNMYFLLTFGDNVEDEFGYAKFLLLTVVSGLFASFTHYFLNPGSTTPCIGASGFISGLIASYTVLFPKVKISFLFAPRILHFGIVNVPAWAAFGVWIIFQIIMTKAEVPGTGSIAYGAHIGGAAAGIAAAAAERYLKRGK